MRTNMARLESAYFTQPDPFEPDADICAQVQEVVAAALSRQTHYGADETFTLCRCCGEWDSHTDACPIPRLEAWLSGD